LVAVRGWEFSPLIVATSAPVDIDELASSVRDQLHEVVAEELGDDPGVQIEERAVEDSPVRALLDAATDDDHLVVGSRGYGGFKGALLGSVSQQVVHYASCPVTVVRASPLHR
jgi:nucleotide-binding universal stress UspA family protein